MPAWKGAHLEAQLKSIVKYVILWLGRSNDLYIVWRVFAQGVAFWRLSDCTYVKIFRCINIFATTTQHLFNSPLSGTTRVSWYHEGKTNQETVGGSGISWAICKSAPRPRQIPAPAPHHSIF